MKICKVEGCDNKHYAKGLCSKHRQRLRNHGSTNKPKVKARVQRLCSVEGCDTKHRINGYCNKHNQQIRNKGYIYESVHDIPEEHRFLKSYKIVESGCWEWLKSTHKAGYGRFGINGSEMLAHRYSYELHKGKIPEGLLVRHKCDNPSCVNPDHLEIGTHSDNANDMIERGRSCKNVGEEKSSSKLKNIDVLEICKRLDDKEPIKIIATDYDVCIETIYHINRGSTWNHITKRKKNWKGVSHG